MILSHKHKYIFLHVPKTGGSSVAVYLSQFLGDNDIMLDAWNDALYHGIGYNKYLLNQLRSDQALNYIREGIERRILDGRTLERPILDYAFRKIMNDRIGSESIHMSWHFVKRLDSAAFNKYKKFTIVRNPFTHAISIWRWQESLWNLDIRKKFDKPSVELSNQSFKEFLLREYKKKLNNKYYSISGLPIYYNLEKEKIEVDEVIKLENIEESIEKLKNELNLGQEFIKLPHAKRNKSLKLGDIYCDECKYLVEQLWKVELKLFAYEFPR